LTVPVISPEMLLKNKSATGRAKDAADIEALRAMLEDHSPPQAPHPGPSPGIPGEGNRFWRM
jgi:hypothetical protein